MCSAAACRLCALPSARLLDTGVHTLLIEALEGVAGEFWIVPKRHLVSCLEARAGEWLEVLVMIAQVQQRYEDADRHDTFRVEMQEPAPGDPSPPHWVVRLIPVPASSLPNTT